MSRLASVYPLVTARAVARPFTYEVPDETGIGAIVEVLFGNARRRGVVTELDVAAPAGVTTAPVERVAATLFPLFESVITTEPYPPRSTSAAELSKLARTMGLQATPEPDPRRALGRALVASQHSIVVAGSLYLAGAAIEFLEEQKGDE